MSSEAHTSANETPAVEDIRAFLETTHDVIVLDGGLATELEARGCDLNDPLWSGKVLVDTPELIRNVADSYLRAGARCLITASYQATPQALQEQRGLDAATAAAVVARSVVLARAARDAFHSAGLKAGAPCQPVFVAGSVGPYGAYLADGSEYRGDYKLTVTQFQDFHRPRIAALVAAGVDVLAVETQPSAAEVVAIVGLLEAEFPGSPCWVSFTLRELNEEGTASDDEEVKIADGTPLRTVAAALERSPSVVAIGVNCVPLHLATRALEGVSGHTKRPLVVYPNSGEVYDPLAKMWSPDPRLSRDQSTLAAHAAAWRRCGARLIGGCCRTGPRDIADLAAAVGQ